MTHRDVLLLTGFEPFGGHASNPSWEAAAALHGLSFGGLTVHSVQLPCVFGTSAQALREALHLHRPRAVVALGLAASRHEISVERVALNLDDARIPDNLGQQPIDEPIVPGAPLAHASSLPIKRIVAELKAQGIAASVSQTAGTYVCNHVFYALMHALQGQGTPAGFIHMPDVSPPAWTLEGLIQAVRVVLHTTALSTTEPGMGDLRITGGAVD